MDSFLFRRFKDSLDEPQLYQQEGRHVLLRKARATIPVILSAPHGGGDKHFPAATASMTPRLPDGKNVSMKADLYTLQMIATIDRYIIDLCGRHPYVVGATVHRKYVDANRNSKLPEENAHHPECRDSEAYYEEYHALLASCVEDCKRRHPEAPHVLLLDIHGQATYRDMVVLGTQHRQSCAIQRGSSGPLQSLHYVDVPLEGFIWHVQSLLGRACLPPPGLPDISPYSGGHIVGRYGAGAREPSEGREQQVSAVQMEFGSSLRSDPVLRGLVAKSTATAVVRSLWPAGPPATGAAALVPVPLEVCSDNQEEELDARAGALGEQACLPSPRGIRSPPSSSSDCGEHGRALVRRLFVPFERGVQRHAVCVHGEAAGCVQGLVYASDSGCNMEECHDMDNATPERMIIGEMFSFSSGGEVAMALLAREDQCQLLAGGWRVGQVHVSSSPAPGLRSTPTTSTSTSGNCDASTVDNKPPASGRFLAFLCMPAPPGQPPSCALACDNAVISLLL